MLFTKTSVGIIPKNQKKVQSKFECLFCTFLLSDKNTRFLCLFYTVLLKDP